MTEPSCGGPSTLAPPKRDRTLNQRRGTLSYPSPNWNSADCGLGTAYRLTWTLVPPPGAPLPGSPSETTLTQSASLSLKYEVALALRSASRLSCGAPEAAVVNPGSWKMTQEPRSSSVRLRGTDRLSVVTLISVPARPIVPGYVVS